MKLWSILTISLATLLLTGCNDSPLADMSDIELKNKAMSCRSNPNPSRTAAIICENVQRECKIRRDQGKRIC